jgi:hypothetical protein
MKKTIRHLSFVILLSAAFPALGQYQIINTASPLSTNIQVSSAYLTVPGYFTNAAYTASNPAAITVGDSWPTGAAKINSNFNYLQTSFAYLLNVPNLINTNALAEMAAFSAYLATNVSSGSVSLPSNVVYSVQTAIAFQTNNAYWHASNFLATVNGLYSWKIYGGSDGGNPPFNCPVSLVGSFNGSTWFLLTNGFWCSNTISVSLVTNGSPGDYYSFPADGGHQVTPGNAVLTTLTDWSHAGQLGVAANLAQMATTNYVANAIANASSSFATATTNATTTTTYMIAGQPIFTTAQLQTWGQPIWTGLDATGTNFLIQLMTTNISGFTLQSNTDLGLLNGWQTDTNYTMVSASGTNTITIPINYAVPSTCFRIIKNTASTLTIWPTLSVPSGTLYPSNAWSLASITNAMPNFSFWTGNSNGQALVTLSLSNGVVRYLQILR